MQFDENKHPTLNVGVNKNNDCVLYDINKFNEK